METPSQLPQAELSEAVKLKLMDIAAKFSYDIDDFFNKYIHALEVAHEAVRVGSTAFLPAQAESRLDCLCRVDSI